MEIAIIQSELPIRLRALAATIRDQHAAADAGRDEERVVCATLTRVARMVEQSDHEADDVAVNTLGACIAIIQSELPGHLRALARATADPHAARDANAWAAELESLAEGGIV